MATSQNGWEVATAEQQDNGPIYGAVRVPNGILAGDVAVVLRWVAWQFHHTIEPLVAGHCWGWHVKRIEGSSSYSNHASGTAIDLNAPAHPMGVATRETFTGAQIDACHAIVNACDGVIRWGGDYTGRPDGMHWEIVKGRSAVTALADRITRGELPVSLTDADKTWLKTEIAKAVWKHKLADPYDNDGARRELEAGTWLRYAPSRAQIAEVLAAVKAEQS